MSLGHSQQKIFGRELFPAGPGVPLSRKMCGVLAVSRIYVNEPVFGCHFSTSSATTSVMRPLFATNSISEVGTIDPPSAQKASEFPIRVPSRARDRHRTAASDRRG